MINSNNKNRNFWSVYLSVVLILFLTNIGLANDLNKGKEQSQIKNHYELLNDLKQTDERDFFDVDFTPRRAKAAIFSTFVPGSGQTYLGDEIKGLGITLAFYGTALAAVIAHNNAQGREERIKVLTQEYNSKGNYNDAEKVWQSILGEKADRDNDYKRRSIFAWSAAVIWAFNVFDVIFLTDDKGENQFSMNNSSFELIAKAHNDFNGIELKLNLP